MIAATEASDRLAITELVSRYFAAVDDERLADPAIVDATFAADSRIVSPHGTATVGRDAIFVAQSTSFARFRATHHVTSDYVIDIDADTARIRANVTAMHLWKIDASDPHALQSHFVAGGVLHAIAIRTGSGWRLTELSNDICWRTGDGLATMMATVLAQDRPPSRPASHQSQRPVQASHQVAGE
ncbi:MAG TPA: nuclear transport factor 2 family protein [Mycobacteriales bacterium]|nr:nuclear transport factor 2 family protein [Mycobacteriales bacterium]